ncbi:hypothetical protein AALP_AA3G298300 [Arabis alpina]|uniref:Leucine-rich repeat-containing N-terminal plant-type domain-containing protein n=1 Tax=Arabis alpina TaxID=50452 RepID=A0A087HCK9_ARAAL|nr:hypothetical protein AALP_AA3G298300 [Arabis alpina]
MRQRRREVKHSHALSSSIFFFFFMIFSLSSTSSSSVEFTDKGDNIEVLALLEIKSSLVDPHGVLMNWDGTLFDPCSWNMIACSPDGSVVSIGAASQNLSGTLAPSIGNLTNLQTVVLQKNSITGHIPHEIGKLMKLKTLDLSTNNFTGQIPFTLSHATNLRYLDLSYNNLSGPVPRSLAIAKIFNVMGNPQICPTGTEKDCNGTQPKQMSTTLNSSQNESSDRGPNNWKLAIAFGFLSCVCLFDHWFSSLVEKKT